MKIQYVSDLHSEFWRGQDRWPEVIGDVLVLAGDITNVTVFGFLMDWLRTITVPVIYVPGNHEYYGSSLGVSEVFMATKLAELPHVHFLNTAMVEIEGVVFIGATLWTHIEPYNEHILRFCTNDLRAISDLTVQEWNHRHNRDKAYIRHVIDATDPEKVVVVVTHYSPSFKSCSDRFVGQAGNIAFHSSLEEFIINYHPDVWIHGHTHDPFDYMIKDTRIVCNPHGYPMEHTAPGYDPLKVIEV